MPFPMERRRGLHALMACLIPTLMGFFVPPHHVRLVVRRAAPLTDVRRQSSSSSSSSNQTSPREQKSFHQRNKHNARYDFAALTSAVPDLKQYLTVNKYKDVTLDFTNAAAVTLLNKALLLCYYGIDGWVIPPEYLTPPVPSRADYVHHVADLVALSGFPPEAAPHVRCLDIGTGANAIYPLIGNAEYRWQFVGTDIDNEALDIARRMVRANAHIGDSIQFRHQTDERNILSGGVIRPGEKFVVSFCNPPFHASVEEAAEGTSRKWRNLGKKGLLAGKKRDAPVLNFGGSGRELVYPGGERSFVRKMIAQSAHPSVRSSVLWFSTLVSKQENLEFIYSVLEEAPDLAEHLTVEMEHGNKRSRIVAWTYCDPAQRGAWVDDYLSPGK